MVAVGLATAVFPETSQPSANQALFSDIAAQVNPRKAMVRGHLPVVFDTLFLAHAQPCVVRDEKRLPLEETLRQAETALGENRLEGALEKCRQAVELGPRSENDYYLLGVVQERRGKPEEAKKALLEALRVDPSHVGSHLTLGRLYLQAHEFNKATSEFQSASRLGDASGAGE